MSYSVSYNPELKKRYPAFRQKSKQNYNILLIILCSVTVGILLTSSGVLRYLLPGDPDVTAAAFSALIDSVSSGLSVKESLYAFCEEILLNAA